MARDNNRYELNRLQRWCVALLYALCRLVAILPRWVRYYLLEDVIYFILQYVVRYRHKVIKSNLRNAFPDKSGAEIDRITRGVERNLAEQIINTLSVTGVSSKRMKSYMTFPDADKYIEAIRGKDVILMGGHCGAWEYFSAVALYDTDHLLMSIYHPLENSALDELFKRMRRCDNTALVPRDESLRFFIKNRSQGKNLAMGLIADQNPYRHKDSHWFSFLNQDTIFAEGGEQLARKFAIPVWFAWMRQRRRGEYEFMCEQIYDGKEDVAEHEITERYVRRLEQIICDYPEQWLWSHRRWKYKREE